MYYRICRVICTIEIGPGELSLAALLKEWSLAYCTSGGELMFLLHHLVQDGLLDGPPVQSDPPSSTGWR